MNHKLLSICIPTYNRSKYLKQCLESIVLQFEDKNVYEKVDVVISDNASTDNTTDVVKEFQNRFSNIKYFKNRSNLGVDKNILNIIEKSDTEYCLPIGDDDAFFNGSFKMILEKIEKTKVPYYMLNSVGYDPELINPVLSHPNNDIAKDLTFEKLSEYVRSIKKYTNLVGGFCGLSHIVKKSFWMDFKDKEKYIGTNAIHFFIILSVFKNAKSIFLAEPVIKTRSSNIRWDVFSGLETTSGRIKGTIDGVKWIKEMYDLPISNTKINLYFYTREYWFTLKEIMKRLLSRFGLGKIIIYYRKIRSMLN